MTPTEVWGADVFPLQTCKKWAHDVRNCLDLNQHLCILPELGHRPHVHVCTCDLCVFAKLVFVFMHIMYVVFFYLLKLKINYFNMYFTTPTNHVYDFLSRSTKSLSKWWRGLGRHKEVDSEWCLQLHQQHTHMFRICTGWLLHFYLSSSCCSLLCLCCV